MTPVPAISMVVLSDAYGTIERLAEQLRRQRRAAEIELVVLTPDGAALRIPAEVSAALARIVVVEHRMLPLGPARAAAVRAATAPLIALGETHAFPDADWADRVIAAHQDDCASIAPGMVNGNPAGALSWAGFLMDYGRWLAAHPEGAIPESPAYNAVHKRESLLAYGDRLADWLAPGGPADASLPLGGKALHVPAARVSHLNVAPPLHWVAERYWGGRLYGARRARRWSLGRRLAYVALSAAVPVLRFIRTMPSAAAARRAERLPPGTTLAIAAGSLFWGVGEALGYLMGEGPAEHRMWEYELHKERYA